MHLAYIFASISIASLTAIIGLLINTAIRNTPFYQNISNMNFIRTEKANRAIGLVYFKHVLVNSSWNKINVKLRIKEADVNKLIKLRTEMTYAEISHLIGFITVIILSIISYTKNFHTGIIIPMNIMNIIFHLYPALLQQYNKRRIDKILQSTNIIIKHKQV